MLPAGSSSLPMQKD